MRKGITRSSDSRSGISDFWSRRSTIDSAGVPVWKRTDASRNDSIDGSSATVRTGPRLCKNAIFKKLVVNRISIFNQWSAIVVHHVSARFNSCSTWGAVPSTPKFSEFLHGLGQQRLLKTILAQRPLPRVKRPNKRQQSARIRYDKMD